MSKATEVNDSNFDAEVLKSKTPVLVDFWASWCGPCKMMAPVIDAVAAEYAQKLKVCKLNVDDNQNTASQYAVMSIPTMILFKNGEEADRLIGFMPQKNLSEKLKPHL